jgi:membrane-associated phospholipid phosphatase
MSASQQPEPFSIRRRLQTGLGFKLVITSILILWISPPYYLLQHYVFFPVTVMKPGRLDLMVAFAPETVWIYLSLYVLMPIGPLLTLNLRHLYGYALGMASMSLFANFAFLLWPTTCQRPFIAQTNAAYQLLVTIDRPLDSCPSLHVAFAVFSALCWEMFFDRVPNSRLWRTGVWGWTLAILYSTISTKQHVAIDVAGGVVLAVVTYSLAFRVVEALAEKTSAQGLKPTQTQT